MCCSTPSSTRSVRARSHHQQNGASSSTAVWSQSKRLVREITDLYMISVGERLVGEAQNLSPRPFPFSISPMLLFDTPPALVIDSSFINALLAAFFHSTVSMFYHSGRFLKNVEKSVKGLCMSNIYVLRQYGKLHCHLGISEMQLDILSRSSLNSQIVKGMLDHVDSNSISH